MMIRFNNYRLPGFDFLFRGFFYSLQELLLRKVSTFFKTLLQFLFSEFFLVIHNRYEMDLKQTLRLVYKPLFSLRAFTLFRSSSFETVFPSLFRRAHNSSALSVKKGLSGLCSTLECVLDITNLNSSFKQLEQMLSKI